MDKNNSVFSVLEKMILNLESRKSMYMIHDYNALFTFLIGFSQGLKEKFNIDILLNFQDWLRRKEEKHFSVHWSFYISDHMESGDSNQATATLFKLLKSFIKELQE